MDIQIKRGLQENVGTLSLKEGEFAFAKDSGNLYIGNGTEKLLVNPKITSVNSAHKLTTARNFSITGDATASAVSFDGTGDVALNVVLSNISSLAAGTYTKVTVDKKGRVTGGTNITIEDLPNIPATKVTGLKTKLSEFTNDSGFQTSAQVDNAISKLVGAAPETLDTLNELAAALGNDPNFATTVSNKIGTKENLIKNSALKEAIVDNDNIVVSDSVDNATKKLKFSTLKAALKSYLDTAYNKYVHPKHTAYSSGLYKITVNNEGHITAAAAVTKGDITALGIPAQDTRYTLPQATASVLGGVKVDGTSITATSGVIKVNAIDGGTF